MTYNVTIQYTIPNPAVEVEAIPTVEIFPTFPLTGSYTDTPAYAGTVYDTNVEGWGTTPTVEPYASTGIPVPGVLGQLKLPANVLATKVEDEETGAITYELKFDVDDYKEANYFAQLALSVADQGIAITVADGTTGADEEAPEGETV